MNKAVTTVSPAPGKFILNCLVSALVGSVILIILSAIASVVLNTLREPDGLYGICAIIICAVSSFAGGVSAKRKNKRSALFCGLLNAGFMILILIAASFILQSVESNAPIWQMLILPAGSVMGAVLAN